MQSQPNRTQWPSYRAGQSSCSLDPQAFVRARLVVREQVLAHTMNSSSVSFPSSSTSTSAPSAANTSCAILMAFSAVGGSAIKTRCTNTSRISRALRPTFNAPRICRRSCASFCNKPGQNAYVAVRNGRPSLAQRPPYNASETMR